MSDQSFWLTSDLKIFNPGHNLGRNYELILSKDNRHPYYISPIDLSSDHNIDINFIQVPKDKYKVRRAFYGVKFVLKHEAYTEVGLLNNDNVGKSTGMVMYQYRIRGHFNNKGHFIIDKIYDAMSRPYHMKVAFSDVKSKNLINIVSIRQYLFDNIMDKEVDDIVDFLGLNEI